MPASAIPATVGQAVGALETVPLLAKALADAGIEAAVTTALAGLIEGALPLDEWVAIVRTTIPPAAQRRDSTSPRPWRRFVDWIKRLFAGGGERNGGRERNWRRPSTTFLPAMKGGLQ